MSEKITPEKEAFLYYSVFGAAEAQELMDLWIKDIIQTPHLQPQIDPNNTKTIRDMAILEFIQGIKNRVEDFIEKGVKDGTTELDGNPVNTANEPANPSIDTGAPGI